MGGLLATLKIVNETNVTIANIDASFYDDNDFNDPERSPKILNGSKILPFSSREYELCFSQTVKICSYNLKLEFDDNSVEIFRMRHDFKTSEVTLNNVEQSYHHITVELQQPGNITKIVVKVDTEKFALQQAQEYLKKADKAIEEKNWGTAKSVIEQSLKYAKLTGKSSEVIKVMEQRAHYFNSKGKFLLQEAWDLEVNTERDRSLKASRKFDEAKEAFLLAQRDCDKPEYQTNIDIVDLKIEGNRLFNEADKLENKAEVAFRSKQYQDAMWKCNASLYKYNAAKEKFDEGLQQNDSRFAHCSEITNQQIKEVCNILETIQNQILEDAVNGLAEDKEDSEEDDVSDFNE